MNLNALDFSSREGISSTARHLYARAPRKARTLQSLRPYICPFEQLLPWVPEKGRLLDIGCGAGLFPGLAGSARPQLSAIGFDADKTAIAAAKSMARAHFPDGRIQFEHRTVQEPWPEGQFDAVSMVDVLHHIPPAMQRTVIDQAFARVAPGGVFIYKDMANRPLFRAWWNRLHDLVLARQWIHYRRAGEIASWLQGSKAKIVARSATNIGPYAHEMIIAKRRG